MAGVDGGRAAFDQHAWAEAYAQLAAADAKAPLDPEDLERLARAADLIGRDEEFQAAFTRAYQGWLERGQVERAARCAFWLGHKLIARGETAHGGGWIARGRQLLADGRDCVEQGYVLLPTALRTFWEGDPVAAHELFSQAALVGERFDDRELSALANLGRGRTWIALQRVPEGIGLLDEVMVAVAADEVSPLVAGIVYCSVLEACQEIYDIRRAQEWTAALGQWCDAQPDMVAFRGPCLVHRAELLQVRGAWPAAMVEAERAFNLLTRAGDESSRGAARYRLAELHRLRGELAEAEDGYREATRLGFNPQPGLALLRLAQGQVEAAVAAIDRALEETHDRMFRSRLLAACVEIGLAAQDANSAGAAARELQALADAIGVPYLRAVAARASGAVLMREGEGRAALPMLRDALALFQELGAPYEAARARVLYAAACDALGDTDTADLERDAARWTLAELGAALDLGGQKARGSATGLTERELDVIRLVATGKTNRAIAAELSVSEKTIARHLSNMFSKLGLQSRAAATAYAYEHNLV